MELVYCANCKKWFEAGETKEILAPMTKIQVDPPEDKEVCNDCGSDMTDTEIYYSSDILELLEKNNVEP